MQFPTIIVHTVLVYCTTILIFPLFGGGALRLEVVYDSDS